MAQGDPNATPEKQLLKLIENPSQQPSLKGRALKRRGFSFFSPGAWVGRLSFFRTSLKERFAAGGVYQLDIKLLNKLLMLCIFLLALYFVSTTYASVKSLKKGVDAQFKEQQESGAGVTQATPVLKAASYYLEKARQRDIFKMVARKKKDSVEDALSARAMEAGKGLRLVGISWSNDPDAMIEDTKTRTTHFIKKGDKFGDFVVEAILRDKVVLSYEGETVELQ